jgi:gas vesicle protein
MNERLPQLSSMLWFIVGGIAGAGITLLLAPQSGKATRQLIARKVNGGADSVRDFRDRVVTRGQEAWDEAGLRVGEAAAALSGSVERKNGKKVEVPSVE